MLPGDKQLDLFAITPVVVPIVIPAKRYVRRTTADDDPDWIYSFVPPTLEQEAAVRAELRARALERESRLKAQEGK